MYVYTRSFGELEVLVIQKMLALVVLCLQCIPNRTWSQSPAEVSADVKHDVSPALRDLPQSPSPSEPKRERPLRLTHPPGPFAPEPDPVLQSSTGPFVSVTSGLNF